MILTALTAWFWWPALFGGQTILHGDAIEHGLPLLARQADWVWGHAALTWSAGVYGGHPLFAEGQGGYANPLNVLFAVLVTPAIGPLASMNWLHAATMLIGGMGMVALCRQLELSFAATLFAAAATIFAPAWTVHQQNLTLSDSLCVIPWVLWAAEVWVARPGNWRGVLLGAAFALEVLGGYPQTAHALALYVAVRMVVAPPEGWRANWRRVAGSLAVGGMVAVGLSAIQLLPLVELVGLSHRAHGVKLPFYAMKLPMLRWFLFSPGNSYTFPGIVGSVMACMLAPAGLLGGRRRLALAHFAALVLMVLIGADYASPLFPLFYDYGLIPGLHFFRLMQVYTIVSCAGIGVLGGLALDSLGVARAARWLVLASVPVWLGLAVLVWPAPFWWLQVGAALAAGGLIAALPALWRGTWLAPALAGLFMVETLALRFAPAPFYPRAELAVPASMALLKAEPDWQQYRTLEADTNLAAYSLSPPGIPDYMGRFHNMLGGFVGMSPLLWGAGGLNGALALELQRYDDVYGKLRAEISGASPAQPGSRLIDVLGVKLLSIASARACAGPGLHEVMRLGAPGAVPICRNDNARKRLQLFAHAVPAANEAAALDLAVAGQALVVESTAKLPPEGAGESSLRVEKAKDTLYRATVTVSAPVWLFVADANYPGWRAEIDGKRAPLYAAQVLGKAVWVPAGTHRVVIRFVPVSVYLGAVVTAATLAALAGFGVAAWRRRTRAGAAG